MHHGIYFFFILLNLVLLSADWIFFDDQSLLDTLSSFCSAVAIGWVGAIWFVDAQEDKR